jgi:hypothetical protein
MAAGTRERIPLFVALPVDFTTTSECRDNRLKQFCMLQSLLLGFEDEGNVPSDQPIKTKQNQIANKNW